MAPSMWVRDQAYIKRRNIQSVLTLLAEHQPVSRAEIARIADMSPTSVTRIASALLSLELVKELYDSRPQGRGRKAVNLQIRHEGLYTLGVSLEPHRVAVGLLDFGNNLLGLAERAILPSVPHDPRQLAQIAHALMTEGVLPDHRACLPRLRAVGVCISGIIDFENGIVQQSDQMRWTDVDVAGAFADVFGLPAYAENDVKACLTGEKARSAIPQEEDAAYLLIGTGVGVGATVRGRIVRGWQNAAGEVGRVPSAAGGLLQDHLVQTYLLRRAQAVEPAVHSMDDIMQAYRMDIGWARLLVGDVYRCLLSTLEMVKGLFSPQTIILGGSLAAHVAEVIAASPLGEQVRIGEDYGTACITGAAIVAQHRAVEVLISREMDEA